MSSSGLDGLVPAELQPAGPLVQLSFDLSTAVDDGVLVEADVALDPAHIEAFMAENSRAALHAALVAACQETRDPWARAQAAYAVLAARQGVEAVALKIGQPGCWLSLKGGTFKA